MGGPYCARCGQRDLPLNPSARVLVGELWGTFGHVDGKVVRTIGTLVGRPGVLTAEYVAGRRVPYLSPINTYLTVAGAYFAVYAAFPDVGVSTLAPARRSAAQARADSAMLADAAAFARRRPGLAGRLALGVTRTAHDPVAAVRAMTAALPRIMFGTVPFCGLLVWAAYRRRGLRYPAHLYFALHVIAFYFVLSTVLHLAGVYASPRAYTAGSKLVGLAVVVYFGLAMQRMYGGRPLATAGRLAFVLVPLLVAFSLAVWFTAAFMLGGA